MSPKYCSQDFFRDTLSADLHATYLSKYPPSEDGWFDSPFSWIKQISSSARRGKMGEALIKEWAVRNGLPVEESESSDADLVINGKRIEVKLSTRWANRTYCFQQIRDQSYDFLLALGISPDKLRMWLVRKDSLKRNVIGNPKFRQHARGTDTFWIRFKEPEEGDPTPPTFMGDPAGDPSTVLKEMKSW